MSRLSRYLRPAAGRLLVTAQQWLCSQPYRSMSLVQCKPTSGDAYTDFKSNISTRAYPMPVEKIRDTEYPHMRNGIYLDHGGTTIYARSLIENFTRQMSSDLYGNPHSANGPARLSGQMVDDIREQTLRFFGADPKHFDLVFVANATAGIKLVADSFRDLAEKTRRRSFKYAYHKDAHTSLVGVRELANGNAHCFESDAEVESWLASPVRMSSNMGNQQWPGLGLFAYPGQSNLSGRRLPLSWAGQLRSSVPLQNTYSLLDAAALAMTSPLNKVFRDVDAAPDFTCISFYKVFGFPDLGGLIVRKDSAHILTLRKYFGGGTVTMVSVLGGAWHKTKGLDLASAESGNENKKTKTSSTAIWNIHDSLEDGTLPFHSILALGEAIRAHSRLYGSMDNIARHTTRLAKRLYDGMKSLRHANGRPSCRIYTEDGEDFGNSDKQGATIAFNVLRSDGSYVAYSDVEKIANESQIFVRSGAICCPGGMFTALQYEPWQLQRALSAHHHCGPEGIDLIHHLPTGVVRASLGSMSTESDVEAFVTFLRQAFVEDCERHHGHGPGEKLYERTVRPDPLASFG